MLVLFFASVILHELVHNAVSRVGPRTVVLYPFGGAAPFRLRDLSPGRALLAALAAPVFNLVLGGIPFLRVSKKGPARKTPGLFVRAIGWMIPKRWQSDSVAGKPGRVRRLLKKISPAWSASPVRKVCQTVCFLAFLYLFIYVCFPYTAKPAKDWHGWLPVEVEPETGVTKLHHDRPTLDGLAINKAIHIVDALPRNAAGKVSRAAVRRMVTA